jgi:YD repeat-containing protein
LPTAIAHYRETGRLATKTAYSGKRTVTERADSTGITAVTCADGSRSVIARDNGGNIVSASGEAGTLRYRYDADGKLVRQEDLRSRETTEYTYDAAGNVTVYRYDNQSRLSMVLYLWTKGNLLIMKPD